ncbi:MAG: GGDEF domain-containing protein, partial [Candidatus Eisenbacteria bacterium]
GVFEVLAQDVAAFDSEDVRLLELLLGHARASVRNLELRDQLREQAIRNPLTGLFNRRHLDDAIAQEIERARRYGHQIGLLMIDVDRFKEINDTLGHAVGDSVLRGIARLILGQVRSAETVYRYGGDEFLVVMPEAGPSGEAARCRLAAALAGWNVEAGYADAEIQLSMGYALWDPKSPRPVTEVIAEADAAMYEDKGTCHYLEPAKP